MAAPSIDFVVVPNDNVTPGICVLINGQDVVYAGPIGSVAWVKSTQMIMHSDDARSLEKYKINHNQ